jgi:hypothetical protein
MFGALWLSMSALEYPPASAAASEQSCGWKYDAADGHVCVPPGVEIQACWSDLLSMKPQSELLQGSLSQPPNQLYTAAPLPFSAQGLTK